MINSVTIIGNLGADPEMRETSGGPVCNLRVATTEKWKGRDGNMQERTEWHSVTVWGNQATACGQYLAKGRQVYVTGRLQSREYQDKDGNNRKVWDIVASQVKFLGGRGEGGGGQQSGGGGWGQGNHAPAQNNNGGWGQQQVAQQAANTGGWGSKKSDDDDPIPF